MSGLRLLLATIFLIPTINAQEWPALLFDAPGTGATVIIKLTRAERGVLIERLNLNEITQPPFWSRVSATLLRQTIVTNPTGGVTALNSIWCADATRRRIVVSVMSSKPDRSETIWPAWHYAEVGDGLKVLPSENGCLTPFEYIPPQNFTNVWVTVGGIGESGRTASVIR